jgi:hypothetical protein
LKEKKKEKERKEELEKNRRPPPPTSPRENTFDSKTASSWRTNKGAGAPAPVRKEEKPKKQYVKDEEGFISKGHTRNAWGTDKPQDAQNPPKPSTTTTKKTEPNIDSNNIYASLVDD